MALIYGPSMVTDGLVFCFDAKNPRSYPGSGTSCYDLMNLYNTGEVVNAPTYDTSGYFSFSTDNYLRFPNLTALDVQTFSVEVWVRTNALSQNGFWFEKGTLNTQYSIFQGGPLIRCRIHDGVSIVNTVDVTTANYMNTSNWFQVVFTFTSGSQFCYINTVVAGTGTTSATVSTNNGGMSIGAYGGYSGTRGYYYNGSLSMCKVYNRVLSQQEVRQNFDAYQGRYGV